MPNDFKKILIIKPSSMGDIVMALPALSALRKSFPNARISWLVRPEFAPLLENHPCINRIILFDRKLLGRAWRSPAALAALFSLVRKLRRERFDAAFDFQSLFRTAALAWLSGCPQRFGAANARECAHLFYNRKVTPATGCVHVVDSYLAIVRRAGAAEAPVEFVLPPDPAAVESVAEILLRSAVDPAKYAVLAPGSAHADKCWPAERFAELADRIAAEYGLSIVAAAASHEYPIVRKIAAAANVPVVNLAGKTSVKQLVALMKNARIVVANDTGPGHIAAALETPVVIIFGRSNPARVAPYNQPDALVAVEPLARGPKPNSPDPKHDIRNITTEDVCRKVRARLAK